MKNQQSPLLQSLVGKTITHVKVSNSHGEVLRITFSDGTKLAACSTKNCIDTEFDPYSVYVSINEVAV